MRWGHSETGRRSLTAKVLDIRRKVPYGRQAGACSLKVPVEMTNPAGEVREGRYQVPLRLVKPEPHSNAALEAKTFHTAMLKRWTEWLAKYGWELASTPQIKGPYELPTPRAGVETTNEYKLYVVHARFRRSGQLYVGLDDFLHHRDEMAHFGLVPEKDPMPWNDMSGIGDTGWVDPLKEAAASRERLGVKLSDYRLPGWWKAARKGTTWQPG